ncbi:WG repeat-containing protein [Algoriphagus halophilus]|uniref:WG repeat-containing protein n=1 Tax=Algoriphagus halophilus TaxID=226505 RepID=UPI00358EDF1A
MNAYGEVVNQEAFDQVLRTNDGYFIVEKANKSGILDSTGKELIPIEFDRVHRAQRDLIVVQKEEKPDCSQTQVRCFFHWHLKMF